MDGHKTGSKKKGKTSKTRRETAVQGTNDNSIVSKCSMAATGYFKDDFLKFFVAKTSRRAPLIHRGYYIRAKTISYIVQEFVQRYSSSPKQIMSLGAGFDSAYFRLKSSGQLSNTVYVEIDFPELMKKKNNIIQNTRELTDLLGDEQVLSATSPHIELNRHDFKMLGVDLTQLQTLEAALRLCKVDFEAPTLILSECVLTYMTKRCSSAIIKWSAETFPSSVFVIYEQINPNDPFGLFMQKHYNVIGSPLKCINSYPTIDSQKDRFLSLGWKHCEAYDMNEFYKRLVSDEEKIQVNHLEPFDEYEEWNLKCSHYFVLCAYSSVCEGLLNRGRKMEGEAITVGNKSVKDLVKIIPRSTNLPIKRFSHSSAGLWNKIGITMGGFGEQDGRHQRISDISITEFSTLVSYLIKPDNPNLEMSRMHHSVATLKDGSLFLVGGRMSPNKLCSQVVKINISACDAGEDISHGAASAENISGGAAQEGDNSGGDDIDSHKKNLCDEENRTASPSNQTHGVNGKGNNPECKECVTETKYEVKFNGLEQTGDVPSLRWRHDTTTVEVEGEEFIFLYGGRNTSQPALDDSFLLNPRTGVWKQVTCTGYSPGNRQTHTVSNWRNKVIVYGGLTQYLLPENTVHCLDLATNIWTKLETKGQLDARYSHTSHVLDDILVLIGGVNLSHNAPGVGLVDLITGRCQEYTLPAAEKASLRMFHKHSSIAQSGGQFVIIGGGGNCFSFGSHLNVSPFVLDISQCLQHFRTSQ